MRQERSPQRCPRTMQAHVERIARQAKALGVLCAITSPEIDHLQ